MFLHQRVAFTCVLLLFIATCTLGCGNGIGRRKREVYPTAPEVDERRANFFGACSPLLDAAKGILPSLPSAVDYTIRDTNWYKKVKANICAGNRDVAECWIYTLDFLLDFTSPLFKAAAQCICDWAGTCFSPSRVYKRSTTSSEVYSIGRPNCPPPPKRPGLTPEQKKFSKCLGSQAKQFVSKYRSLRRFDGKSVVLFLRDHYTFCRTIPDFPYEQRNLFRLLYVDRLCPRAGAKWRADILTVFKEATRTDGPISRGIAACRPSTSPPVFGPWGPWTPCNPTCGQSWRVRTRRCLASVCNGVTQERQPCSSRPCPDACKPNPCKNRGKCVVDYLVVTAGIRCECPRGFTGVYCENRINFGNCNDSHGLCGWSRDYFCNSENRAQCRSTCGLCEN